MTTREQALKNARNELGNVENPAGSNLQKYGAWYGMNGQPWCAMFVTWCAVRAGSVAFAQGARWSYCPYFEQDARAGRYGLKVVGGSSGEPGDALTFDWTGDGTADHIGFVEKNLGGGSYQTIEGNTSTTNQSNGGQVMRRTRGPSEVSLVVRYPNEGEKSAGVSARVLAAANYEGEPMFLYHDVFEKTDTYYIGFDSGLVRRVLGDEANRLKDAGVKVVKIDAQGGHNRLVQYDAALRDQEKAD